MCGENCNKVTSREIARCKRCDLTVLLPKLHSLAINKLLRVSFGGLVVGTMKIDPHSDVAVGAYQIGLIILDERGWQGQVAKPALRISASRAWQYS
jgi:hypothetical protein